MAAVTQTRRTPRWDAQDIRRTLVPQILAVSLVVAYFVVMFVYVWYRHERFGTFDYDLGMYDQGIWNLSRGAGFMTLRGMHVFGHHANLGYLLMVPFYWVGLGGPHFLNFINTLSVVACTVPLYAMARKGLRSDWAGLGVTFAFLFHYVPQWMIHETFHPENLAAPFIIGALWYATEQRWRAYWICIGLAMIWKEDVALVVMMLGIVVGFVGHSAKRGLLTSVVGAVWFVFCIKVFIPFFAPDGAVFDGLFGELGKSASEVVGNAVSDPARARDILSEHGADQGAIDMMAPFGFAALGSPHLLSLGLPQHIVNYLSVQNFTWSTEAHYAMFPFVAVALASVRTAITRSRRWLGMLIVLMMMAGVLLGINRGIGPWSERASQGYWPGESPIREANLRAALDVVPPDASVSAPYFLTPHLSHRPEIYTFPNPWRLQNWTPRDIAVQGPAPPETARIAGVQYLINEPTALDGADAALYASIANSGEFEVVAQFGTVVVLHRIKPPSGTAVQQ